MTAADRRLGALLAAFAPARARELAARLGDASAPGLAAHAARLAAAARRERLAAVAAALAPERAGPRGMATGLLAAERPRVALLLAEAGQRVRPPRVSPALARLLRDRRGS